MEEDGESSELEYTNVDAAVDALDSSTIFHLVSDILRFILFMHQQIPSVLQDITHEFDDLESEFKELVTNFGDKIFSFSPQLPHSQAVSSKFLNLILNRKLSSLKVKQSRHQRGESKLPEKREAKMGIKRLEKLMGSTTNLKSALQLMIAEVPNVEKISLVLGPSPLRPLHIYEFNFSNGRQVFGAFSRSKTAETLSRKAIRAMISKGVGSNSYAGPTKLFLLVKAPSHFNLPMHFLPKREFRPNRKAKPFRLRFRCRTQHLEMNPQPDDYGSSVEVQHSTSKDLI